MRKSKICIINKRTNFMDIEIDKKILLQKDNIKKKKKYMLLKNEIYNRKLRNSKQSNK